MRGANHRKDALASTVRLVTSAHQVPLLVCRGFASLSYAFEATEWIREQGVFTRIIYFGDMDPSGWLIDQAFRSRLAELVDPGLFELERIGIRPETIEAHGLHSSLRPVKDLPDKANSHRAQWKEQFGEDALACKLDALPPDVLRALVEDEILAVKDEARTAKAEAAQKQDDELLRALAELPPSQHADLLDWLTR